MKPVVYLIGAGPGDPGLLTLRGAERLARSQVVLYDGLSNTELLRHAPSAEHINVGKHGQSRIWNQAEIIEVMLEHARQGKVVARLKGGDPAVFARTAEEIDALVAAGIDFEVVPGITAALAAGSFAGIPITHRKLASAVALITGREEPDKPESALDWEAIARFPGTLVIYMGVTTAQAWTDALIAGGKDPSTPAALVRRCSLPDQVTVHCRLDQIASKLTPASEFRPPVIAIIGPVTTLSNSMDWLRRRPLFGKTVLVTRPAGQGDTLAQQILDAGGQPVIAPVLQIQPPADDGPLDRAITRLDQTDVLIFVSTNGVDAFFQRLDRLGRDARSLAGVHVAVVGRKTARRLGEYGIRADVVPDDFRAGSLADQLQDQVAGKRVVIIRASRGSETLPERLSAAGADVRQVVGYQNVDVSQPDPVVAEMMAEGKIDWVTVTSSATARNLDRLYGVALRQCRIAALSPVTAETLRELGLTVDAVADPYTTESLLDEIIKQS
ncbi:uroporphyrinogen-III C-methyltransferase [Roseiconus nitratireducens]|uniref:uroporphyrinogen-III C-methyltransferase n=1 Tax=Roseiconus nitratireducens TaxID=2605748 RepID=A0A5M6D268_9BACT|nr:uroporphyrinogen-III C-methyltransferase [Roseiconus nitratireducens]KAA5541106.1 uroporphyrinogen-III C-methyltransferase [Roseiconus nitratireducens]